MDKLIAFDLHSVGIINPDIVILEIGSNDLCSREVKPVTVVSKIEALMQHLHAHFRVKFIVVCQTINHGICPKVIPCYNDLWPFLTSSVVLKAIEYAEFWPHKGLCEQNFPILCQDGVHLNKQGQYKSYPGEILCACMRIFSPVAHQGGKSNHTSS